jgi:hypothetical protein
MVHFRKEIAAARMRLNSASFLYLKIGGDMLTPAKRGCRKSRKAHNIPAKITLKTSQNEGSSNRTSAEKPLQSMSYPKANGLKTQSNL